MHGGNIILFRMSLPLAHPHGTGTPPPTPNTEAPLQMPPQSNHGASSDWLNITAAVMFSTLGAVLVVAVIVIIASMEHDRWFTSVCGRSCLLKLKLRSTSWKPLKCLQSPVVYISNSSWRVSANHDDILWFIYVYFPNLAVS